MGRVRARVGPISRDLRKARKVRDMLHSTIARRCVQNFSDCSKTPIIYGFSVRLIFARLQRVRPAREARATTKPAATMRSAYRATCAKNFLHRGPQRRCQPPDLARIERIGPQSDSPKDQRQGPSTQERGQKILASSSLASVFRRPSCVVRDQMPSFVLKSAFTACGLALPPDAFMT